MERGTNAQHHRRLYWATRVHGTALEKGGLVWLLEVLIRGEQTEALVDTGASSSLVAPSMVAKLKIFIEEMDSRLRVRVASASELVVRTVVRQANFRSGDLETSADFPLARIPYNMVLRTDSLCPELVGWDFGDRRLMVHGDKRGLELPVVENVTTTDLGKPPAYRDESFEVHRHQADEGRRLMVEDVERLGRGDAAALVRPAPKRYKNFKTRTKLVPIKNMLEELQGKLERELGTSGG